MKERSGSKAPCTAKHSTGLSDQRCASSNFRNCSTSTWCDAVEAGVVGDEGMEEWVEEEEEAEDEGEEEEEAERRKLAPSERHPRTD